METAIHEVETADKVLTEIKEKQKTQITQLRAIRKNIEVATNIRMTEKERLPRSSSIHASRRMSKQVKISPTEI